MFAQGLIATICRKKEPEIITTPPVMTYIHGSSRGLLAPSPPVRQLLPVDPVDGATTGDARPGGRSTVRNGETTRGISGAGVDTSQLPRSNLGIGNLFGVSSESC